MKLWTRVTVVMLAGLLATMGSRARAVGSGGGPGGHGGSGGHGGRGGFSSGRSSGAGIGHAIGHSLGHLFGHHSKVTGNAHDGAQIVSAPARHRFRPRPINDFPFGDRFLSFPLRPGFEGCAGFGFPRYNFSFDDDFNCFASGLFFDAFFIAGYSASFFGSPAFQPYNDQELDYDYIPDDSGAEPPAEAAPAWSSDASDLGQSGGRAQNFETYGAASAGKAKSEQPVTLLQMRDGSMYGLVDYWVQDGQLHYTTTYGGQNCVALDRIDLEKTVQLNAERGIQFVLRPKTPRR
jgi:hypothetical protein